MVCAVPSPTLLPKGRLFSPEFSKYLGSRVSNPRPCSSCSPIFLGLPINPYISSPSPHPAFSNANCPFKHHNKLIRGAFQTPTILIVYLFSHSQ